MMNTIASFFHVYEVINHKALTKLRVQPTILIVLPQIIIYRMEGNFGSGKIWRIYNINTLARENLANLCNSLSENISEMYSVKHSKRLH